MVSITIWITCPGSTPMRARWQAATAYSAHCCACSTSWITARSPPDTLSDALNDSCLRPRRTHAPSDRHHPQALAAGWRPAAYRVAYTTLGPSRHYRLDRQPRLAGTTNRRRPGRRQPLWGAHIVFGRNTSSGNRRRHRAGPGFFPRPGFSGHQRRCLVRLESNAVRRYCGRPAYPRQARSAEHTSELQSLMRISCLVFYLKKKTEIQTSDKTHTLNI